MSSSTWKLKNDLCRCCHAEGSFYNLSEPRIVLGQTEVYSEMLKNCFSIELPQVVGMMCTLTYTICESCIRRLRDATAFKQQVLLNEQRFTDIYKNSIKNAISQDCGGVKDESTETFESEVKQEYVVEENDDFHVKYESEDDQPVINIKDNQNEHLIQIKIEEKKTKSKRKAEKKLQKTKKVPKKKIKEGAVEERVETVDKRTRGDPQFNEFILETTDIKRYSCRACKVAYRRISDLRNHITRTHLRTKFIKCQMCSETFMYHSQRKRHMELEHNAEKAAKFICGDCGREFKRKNTLSEHMMDVHIEKKCQKCVLKFTRKKILFHMNEAHNYPMPTCGICGLRAAKESALIRHQRNVHLNEKDKKCSVCEKRFYTQSNLQDHMITHTQKKRFKCTVCEKLFSRKECFKAHCRIHSGDRPYRCKVCSAAFVHRASLRFHLKNHHTT